MNCIASTYDASGKLIGCTEQDMIYVISLQMYTMFALGTGLYLYKTFTSENWTDIAVTIGWGCVSTFTYTKRAVVKYVLPVANFGIQLLSTACSKIFIHDADADADTDDDSNRCRIRLVKDGVETSSYSSVFKFVHDLDENFTEPSCPRRSRSESDADGDVVNVQLSEDQDQDHDEEQDDQEEDDQDDQEEDDQEDQDDQEQDDQEEEDQEEQDDQEEEEEDQEDDQEEEEEEEDISETIKRIENHTMQFDFMLSEVPTAQTVAANDSKEGVHVMKYDGFPRDSAGIHFYDRQFTPVDHRMMEVVLQHEGKEYDMNLASPDNFYVAGNKLLDPVFVKWFMLKNHGIQIGVHHSSEGVKCDYTIKCLDNTATLHTLQPHNYLYISVNGFEVHDSGLV
jgi:hypothetical protein